jgi:AcrR family transcriptional regulator
MVDGSALDTSRISPLAPALPRAEGAEPKPTTPRPRISHRINPRTGDRATKQSAVHLSRAQILHATAICLAESGYDGTTIRRIAKQLNCAVGSIYRYFDDKRSLLDAVTQARFEPVAQVAEVSAERSAALYAHAAADEPQQYRLMFWLASVEDHQEVPGVPDVIGRIIAAWTEQMGDRRKAERFWAQLHGRIMLGEVGPKAPQPV